MRARLVIALLCALSILVGLSGGLYGRWQHAEAQAAQAYADSLERSNKALRGRLGHIQTELQEQRNKRKEAEDALAANPSWANGAVPDAIHNGLCQRIRCR